MTVAKTSYSTFLRVFKKINIVFSTPEQAKCAKCVEQELHLKQIDHTSEDFQCDACKTFVDHKQQYTLARKSYKKKIFVHTSILYVLLQICRKFLLFCIL